MPTTTHRIFVSLFFLGCATAHHAQWSSDPAAPLVICNAEGYQDRPEVISDGASGWFVFWSDDRNSTFSEVYGQHLDGDGVALWEPNGKLILSASERNLSYTYPLLMEDGSIMLAYISWNSNYSSELNVERLDQNGESLWAAPVRLASTGPGPLGDLSRIGSLTGVRNGSEAVFAWMYILFSEDDGPYAFERVALDGSTHFGDPGKGLPDSGRGQMAVFNDNNGGLVFHWKGLPYQPPSPLLAMRVDEEGTPLWSQNLTLGQAYNMSSPFSTTADGDGTFYTAWSDTNRDIQLTATDTSGQFMWAPNATVACDQPDGQLFSHALLHDEQLFVAWADGRPPAADFDLYLQGFSLNGEALWEVNGIPVIQAASEYPRPSLVPSSNGSVIATFPALDPGFLAMRVMPDGSLAWPGPVQFCTSEYNPYGLFFRVLPDAQGGAVAIWQIGPGDIFGARIDASGQLGVGIEEPSRRSSLDLYPNPATTHVTLSSSNLSDGRYPISLLDLAGRVIFSTRISVSNGRAEVQLPQGLAMGRYELDVQMNEGHCRQALLIGPTQ